MGEFPASQEANSAWWFQTCVPAISHMLHFCAVYLPTKLGDFVAHVGVHIPAPWFADGIWDEKPCWPDSAIKKSPTYMEVFRGKSWKIIYNGWNMMELCINVRSSCVKASVWSLCQGQQGEECEESSAWSFNSQEMGCIETTMWVPCLMGKLGILGIPPRIMINQWILGCCIFRQAHAVTLW